MKIVNICAVLGAAVLVTGCVGSKQNKTVDRGFDSKHLSQLQAGIQRYLFPELWDPIIATVLLWPAWVVFGGLGAILLALFRRRPRKRRWFSR